MSDARTAPGRRTRVAHPVLLTVLLTALLVSACSGSSGQVAATTATTLPTTGPSSAAPATGSAAVTAPALGASSTDVPATGSSPVVGTSSTPAATSSSPATSTGSSSRDSSAGSAAREQSRSSTSTAASPRYHQVVGLGDSVPAGSGCNCDGFVSGVAQQLSTPDHRVTAVNLAVSGSTSSDLLEALTGEDDAPVIAASDLVLVEIGANDISFAKLTDDSCLGSVDCWQDDLSTLDSNMRRILTTLKQLRQTGSPATIAVLGYWNVGESGDVGAAEGSVYVRNARALTDAVNAVLERDARAAGAVWVDTYAAFGPDDSTTGLLAQDGDHPNAKGHDLLATTVVSALRAAGR